MVFTVWSLQKKTSTETSTLMMKACCLSRCTGGVSMKSPKVATRTWRLFSITCTTWDRSASRISGLAKRHKRRLAMSKSETVQRIRLSLSVSTFLKFRTASGSLSSCLGIIRRTTCSYTTTNYWLKYMESRFILQWQSTARSTKGTYQATIYSELFARAFKLSTNPKNVTKISTWLSRSYYTMRNRTL